MERIPPTATASLHAVSLPGLVAVETSVDGSQTKLIDPTGETTTAPALAQGASVGRYLILEEVGRGGMGQVYRAYDPKLGREVAIKRLSLRNDGLSTEGATRMMREAQAMAKLSHPNVVPVYDVEGDGTEWFIAMEFVAGQSLRQWLDAAPRSWTEVVAIFGEAGKGLAAAHGAGLVHRDFKPGNVMMGEDGRARVMDFGLARADIPADPGDTTTTHSDADDQGSTSNGLTQAGTVMGTPAYMAPEQHLDDLPLGLASDQYSFCVALWEALYRSRPFEDGDYRTLVSAKLAGPPSAPAGSRVPPWLHRVVERGLAPEAGDRWASMEDLLLALGRDPAARRVKIVGGLLGVGLVGAVGWAAASASAPVAPCEDAPEQLASAWSEGSGQSITTALEGAGRAYAAETAQLTVSALDEYAQRWAATYEDACRATHERRTQSPEVLDRRMACLNAAHAELGMTVGLLSHDVTAQTVQHASRLVGGLPRLERCSDIEALLADVPPPTDPAIEREVEALEAELAKARAQGRAARVSEALETTGPLVARARDTGYMPIHARVLLAHSHAIQDTGELDEATSYAKQAHLLGLESGDVRTAAFAAMKIAFILGDRQGKIEPAHRWLETAGALARRLDPGGVPEAWYLNNLGNVLKAEGRTDEAIDAFGRAEAIFVELLGPEHENVGMVLNNAGIALNEQRRPKEALPKLERSVELKGVGMGPRHPSVGMGLTNLGLVLFALHRYEDALDRHTRARDVFAASLGEDHPHYAAALTNMGMSLTSMDRLDEAEPLLRESLRIKEERFGPDHRGLVPQLVNLAQLAGNRDDPEQALALLERAYQILIAHHGERHPFVAMTQMNLGAAHAELGHETEARRLLDQAIAYFEDEDGPEAPMLAPSLSVMAELEILEGNDATALTLFERVEAIQLALDVPAAELAATHFSLAKLRWARPEDRDDALALARRALEGYATDDGPKAAEIRQWLTEHE